MWFERPLFTAVLSLAGLALFLTLGSVIFVLMAGLPLDEAMPWTALENAWKYGYHAGARAVLLQSHGLSALVIVVATALCWQTKKPSLHGDARWATARDLKKADPSLLADKGIFLGQFKNKYLVQGGQSFAMVAAGTRGGKGISVVIPNCLNWSDSLVVTDIKLENFKITAGYRAECGHKVFLFSPAPQNRKTHRWNPLDYISRDEHQRISDVQRIAALLIADSREPMWSSDARELFIGVTLMMMDNPQLPFTLGEVYRQLRPEKGVKQYFTDIIENNKEEILCKSTAARMILSKYAEMADKQLTGVLSSLSPVLNLFANPVLDAATSASDFDFRTLRQRKQTIYLGVTPSELDTYQSILRLFFQQLVDVNTRELPTRDDPYQVLLLMDEFPALGKMEALVKAASFIAGYNLRLLPIIQSLAQLRDIYKEESDTFIENMATRVFFAAKNHKTATDIANELGDTTTTSQSQSRDRGFSGKLGSKTDSVAKRGLLLPQEVKTIGVDNLILLSDNCPPVLAKKAVYYKIDAFLERCVAKDKLEEARKTTTQANFLAYVRPTPEIPLLTVVPHVMRGLKEAVDTDPASILPEGGQPLTEDQVESAAGNLFAALMMTA